MLSEPLVCAVMLTRDRPEMAARAVRCFRAQTYKNSCLVIRNSGDTDLTFPMRNNEAYIWPRERGEAIGTLRNEAIQWSLDEPDLICHCVICHWDDDDYSHPNRIAEQVSLLQSSGADAVGYNDMLFWRDLEAWIYRAQIPNYALGTSLCYWRRTWERKKFRDISVGEDLEWQTGINVKACSSWVESIGGLRVGVLTPRMIASIHGGNTSSKVEASKPEWSRHSMWDDYCRRSMETV